MELTRDDIEILRNDEKGGFTEETIALLMHDKAPEEVVSSAKEILKQHRRNLKRKAKKEEAYLKGPVSRGEYNGLIQKIASSVNPLIANVDVIGSILNAKGLITDSERAAFNQVDLCPSCTGKRPVAGGHCPPPKGTRRITTFDVWPEVDYKLVDKVLQCPLYKAKPEKKKPEEEKPK